MKKLFVLVVLSGIFYLSNPVGSQAQEVVIEMSKKEKKAQKEAAKVEKAKKKLEKNREKLIKMKEKYDKSSLKFQEKNEKGDLSPNEVTKEKKSLKKQDKR